MSPTGMRNSPSPADTALEAACRDALADKHVQDSIAWSPFIELAHAGDACNTDHNHCRSQHSQLQYRDKISA